MASKKLQETRKALRKTQRGHVRSGLGSLATRAELAIAARDKKRARACMAALTSAAINFPNGMSKAVAVATIVGVLVDAKRLGINLRQIGIGWDRNRRCSLAGDRRCVASARNTCFEDPTGCISTPGNPPSLLLAVGVRPLHAA
jgi:hypothetical protein